MNILLVGFGDLAQRLASQLVEDDCSIVGIRRTVSKFAGVELVAGDCSHADVLTPLVAEAEVIIVTLTPDSFSAAGYQQAYVQPAQALVNALNVAVNSGQGYGQPKRILWVSSTRVYGEAKDDWCDELLSPKPQHFSSKLLMEAEQLVGSAPVPSTVIRFSGIYGRGQPRIVTQVRQEQCVAASPPLWTNRIHVEDCVAVLRHFCQMVAAGQTLADVYVASDCQPVPLREVQEWLADELGVPVVEGKSASPLRANRRCSNQRLLDSGFVFKYSDYKEGYGAILAAQSLK